MDQMTTPLRSATIEDGVGMDTRFGAPGSEAASAASSAEFRRASRQPLSRFLTLLAIDIAACVVFGFAVRFCVQSAARLIISSAALLVAMALWRVRLRRSRDQDSAIPYTCVKCAKDGKELYLVATLHISPRSPEDARAVIEHTHPDIVMIELDAERLDEMREEQSQASRQREMQPIQITQLGSEPVTLYGARAVWNAERSRETISGHIAFDEHNMHGAGTAAGSLAGSLALFYRGPRGPHDVALSLKAHNAARCGAVAVLAIDGEGAPPPPARVGVGALAANVRVAYRARSCGFPPIPLLLLSHADGQRLREACQGRSPGAVRGEFRICPDDYPRRTLPRQLCQACMFVLSGIVILYGIIECLAVDVGDEFMVAERVANTRQIPCVCIDMDVNRLCSRIGAALVPSPRNICKVVVAWLAVPRLLFRLLFPAPGSLDAIGSLVLHIRSFRLRTWVAFVLAAACAGGFVGFILMICGFSAAGAAEGAGLVQAEDLANLEAGIMLGIELYIFPCIYEAVAASRDEAMYRGIVTKSREHGARRFVAVVGAAHANGILQRVKTRGLA